MPVMLKDSMLVETPIPPRSDNTDVVSPFPGSLIIISATVPMPEIILGQGGEIRTALIPTGFTNQDLLSPTSLYFTQEILHPT